MVVGDCPLPCDHCNGTGIQNPIIRISATVERPTLPPIHYGRQHEPPRFEKQPSRWTAFKRGFSDGFATLSWPSAETMGDVAFHICFVVAIALAGGLLVFVVTWAALWLSGVV